MTKSLILLSFFFTLTLNGVNSDLFVVLFQGCQILTSLGELTFFHTLSDVVMHESSLGVHQVELVIQSGPGLGDGGGVAQHAHGSLHLGQVTSGHNSGWLVVDADLETSWAPVYKLDGSLGLDGGNGGVDILGHNITSVQETTGHVFAVSGITFHHLVGGLETGVGDFSNSQLFVVGLLG